MKIIIIYIVIALSIPVLLQAQYTGGNGRGDASVSYINVHILIYDITTEIPSKYDLAQNYPNPFNPVTTIAYGIPVSGNVKLKVFDMSGREIISIVSDFKDAGYYLAKYDASSLATGTYIYRIECGNFVSAMKMLLLK